MSWQAADAIVAGTIEPHTHSVAREHVVAEQVSNAAVHIRTTTLQGSSLAM